MRSILQIPFRRLLILSFVVILLGCPAPAFNAQDAETSELYYDVFVNIEDDSISISGDVLSTIRAGVMEGDSTQTMQLRYGLNSVESSDARIAAEFTRDLLNHQISIGMDRHLEEGESFQDAPNTVLSLPPEFVQDFSFEIDSVYERDVEILLNWPHDFTLFKVVEAWSCQSDEGTVETFTLRRYVKEGETTLTINTGDGFRFKTDPYLWNCNVDVAIIVESISLNESNNHVVVDPALAQGNTQFKIYRGWRDSFSVKGDVLIPEESPTSQLYYDIETLDITDEKFNIKGHIASTELPGRLIDENGAETLTITYNEQDSVNPLAVILAEYPTEPAVNEIHISLDRHHGTQAGFEDAPNTLLTFPSELWSHQFLDRGEFQSGEFIELSWPGEFDTLVGNSYWNCTGDRSVSLYDHDFISEGSAASHTIDTAELVSRTLITSYGREIDYCVVLLRIRLEKVFSLAGSPYVITDPALAPTQGETRVVRRWEYQFRVNR